MKQSLVIVEGLKLYLKIKSLLKEGLLITH